LVSPYSLCSNFVLILFDCQQGSADIPLANVRESPSVPIKGTASR
jgi:hypothetical protein